LVLLFVYVTCIFTICIFNIYALLLFYQWKFYCTAFFYAYIMSSYISYVIHASVMFWFWPVSYSTVSSPMLDLWNCVCVCVCVCVRLGLTSGFSRRVLRIKFCLNHFFHVFCISHVGYLIRLCFFFLFNNIS